MPAPDDLSAGQKAARTRKLRAAGQKAAQTRKRMGAFTKARAAEAGSKEALRLYCEDHGWRLAFFEGATGAPRTGIIDAIAFRLGRKDSDLLDVRLIQLKGGKAGVSGREIARLKKAAAGATVNWLIAEFDGETLHLLPDNPIGVNAGAKVHQWAGVKMHQLEGQRNRGLTSGRGSARGSPPRCCREWLVSSRRDRSSLIRVPGVADRH